MSIAESPVVHTREAFVTHIGKVTVNNFGAVSFEANVGTPIGLVVREPAKVIISVDTLREISSVVRSAIADMKKDGVYER